jgi:hypothetical protein
MFAASVLLSLRYQSRINVVVRDKFLQRKAELAHIVSAIGLSCSVLGGGQSGKNQAGQYADHTDHHQKFSKRKCPIRTPWRQTQVEISAKVLNTGVCSQSNSHAIETQRSTDLF